MINYSEQWKKDINLRQIVTPKIVYGGIEDFRNLFKNTMRFGFDGVIARDI